LEDVVAGEADILPEASTVDLLAVIPEAALAPAAPEPGIGESPAMDLREPRPPFHASPAVKTLYAVVREALAAGQEVRLPGVGVLKVTAAAARTGRNPQTGEAIEIPAHNRLRFSLAGELKYLLNQG
jgi:DNA-binding protein HU-beta